MLYWGSVEETLFFFFFKIKILAGRRIGVLHPTTHYSPSTVKLVRQSLDLSNSTILSRTYFDLVHINFDRFSLMSETKTQPGVSPDERVAIGISYGNSYSSIASTIDDSPVVIANEDGGTK